MRKGQKMSDRQRQRLVEGKRKNQKNLVGVRNDMLLVLRELPKRIRGHRVYECLCDCGKKLEVTHNNINSGGSGSCGCRQRSLGGLWSHPLHKVWESMMARCYREKTPHYHNYGGRGITVCERWHEFLSFFEDVVSGYKHGLSLDRINNDGNYEPSNTRWATPKQQMNNRRTNVRIEFQGVTRTLAEWSEAVGISDYVLSKRIRSGVPLELAFTLKPGAMGKKKMSLWAKLITL